jgi:hypothetical protein
MKWKTKFVLKGGTTMIRRILWVLVIMVFAPCIAFAQRDVKLEFEGRYWFTDLEGNVKVTDGDIGTDINLKKDLDIKDEGYPEARLTWYTGKNSKIRIAYTQVGYDGDTNLQRTIVFNGTTYNVGTRVVTDFDIRYVRLGWAWQFINIGNGTVKLGTLLEGMGFWGKVAIEAPDLAAPIKESAEYVFGLPTLGIALDINPHKILNIFAEGSGMTAGSYGYVYDAEVGIKLIPIKILSIMGGYRIMEFRVESDDDFVKTRVHGPFVGVTVRF